MQELKNLKIVKFIKVKKNPPKKFKTRKLEKSDHFIKNIHNIYRIPLEIYKFDNENYSNRVLDICISNFNLKKLYFRFYQELFTNT